MMILNYNYAAAMRLVGRLTGAVASVISLWLFALPIQAGAFTSLAFGSCNHSHLKQPMWSIINSHEPDVFLWLGDVNYADTEDTAVMRQKYQQQLENKEYLKFRDNVPVIGIWDDHDFGNDNVGRKNPIKIPAQQMFLDFLQEPAESPRRTQQGIYTTYEYGDGAARVKLFLLDTRYHRDSPGIGRADILGEVQWQWLAQELEHSSAPVNIIASGFSVLSQQIPFAEEWRDFKWSRKRLFSLLEKHQVPGVIFLVGDRHFSATLTESNNERDYHEFMSSGLTHYLYRPFVSRVFRSYYGAENSYFGRNFSKITFDWAGPVSLTFQVFDDQNQQQLKQRLVLDNGYWVR